MILACQKLLGQIIKVLGLRRPLPPYVGKNSQIIPYLFSEVFPKKGLSGDQLYNIQLTTNSQKIGWISQSSALPVFQATVQALLVKKDTSMVSSVSPWKMKMPNPVLLALHLRLGRHWSPIYLHRQTARNCSSHRPKQQLYRENEPDWGCQRRPDCVCGWCWKWGTL